MMDCILCQEQMEESDGDLVWVSLDVSTNKCLVHRDCYEKMLEKVDIGVEHDDRGRDE